MQPLTAIGAASHPDPYPYYRQLLAGPRLFFDTGLRLWIASREAVIQEVLGNPHCVVRPAGELVPAAIAGSSAGAIYSRLIRMNEGAGHVAPRRATGQALAALDLSAVARQADQFACVLGAQHGLPDGAAFTRWTTDMPTYVVAHLLGLGEAELPRVALWMADFVRCLSPMSTPEQLGAASLAARALHARFAQLVQVDKLPSHGLVADLIRQAALARWADHDGIVANLIGLLSQTHEASAGLIGNSVVALLSQPELQAHLRAEPQLAPGFVREAARYDPPVQNTRRFVKHATRVAGVALQPGDTILLLLAAAGRDPHVHAQPDRFLLERPSQPLTGFGHGRHACRGQALAMVIAMAAIRHVLALPRALDPAALGWTYRPSADGRLPQFFTTPLKEPA